MNDVLRALGIAAGILFPVVFAIILISIAAVRRGEANNAAGHGIPDELLHVKPVAAAPSAKGAKLPAGDEISVPQILVVGTGMFVLMILALLALSLIQHAG